MIGETYQTPDYAFFVLNIIVVAAYLSAAVTLMFSKRILPILGDITRSSTRIFGAIFFVVASVTRVELAYHAVVQEPYLNLTNSSSVPVHVNVEHAIQAVSIWIFLAFMAKDLVLYKGPKSVRNGR
jgi:hypothetical protein